MAFLIGTSGYSYPKWKGTFYPEKLPTNEMLNYYSSHFQTVEINNTFYRPPTEQFLRAWARQVPANFRFVLKAPQDITHTRRLVNTRDAVTHFARTANALESRLGALLFQLPPNFRKDESKLAELLEQVPVSVRIALEFRHESWFCDEVFALLKQRDAAMCLADADDDLEVPFVATASWGYLRLRRDEYGDTALQQWALRVAGEKWNDAFVFFKHEDTGTGPRYAAQLANMLAAQTPATSTRRAA